MILHHTTDAADGASGRTFASLLHREADHRTTLAECPCLAICRNPGVFLFDAPLSNPDAFLRVAPRLEIARLKQSVIHVTHDQAMTLVNRIGVLAGGRVARVGTPMTLYHHPADVFVARFIGALAKHLCPAAARRAALRQAWEPAPEGDLRLGIRPKHLSITAAPPSCRPASRWPKSWAKTPRPMSRPRPPPS
ncbi:hypothetical protein NX862_14155 [Rhodobacter sp. KR11]|uniref:hypothetical protein n=1 Tax=Rhodobacter sp. KR11 TaxID=2974588 RepID=UPI002221B90D|nr:hypothetical protein [Rhodobacter sp. KR11]MCW1919899.1 hypothetical protein [Rhodobacter sp. KR11]